MKETFAGVRAAYFKQHRIGHSVVRGRFYRWTGRVCLLGAAVSGSVEIFSAGQGNTMPPVTLRSLFGLSPDVTAPSLQPLIVPIEFAVGSPLWIVLLVAAAIPYALAVQLFIKEKPVARMGERP